VPAGAGQVRPIPHHDGASRCRGQPLLGLNRGFAGRRGPGRSAQGPVHAAGSSASRRQLRTITAGTWCRRRRVAALSSAVRPPPGPAVVSPAAAGPGPLRGCHFGPRAARQAAAGLAATIGAPLRRWRGGPAFSDADGLRPGSQCVPYRGQCGQPPPARGHYRPARCDAVGRRRRFAAPEPSYAGWGRLARIFSLGNRCFATPPAGAGTSLGSPIEVTRVMARRKAARRWVAASAAACRSATAWQPHVRGFAPNAKAFLRCLAEAHMVAARPGRSFGQNPSGAAGRHKNVVPRPVASSGATSGEEAVTTHAAPPAHPVSVPCLAARRPVTVRTAVLSAALE